jgi:hypothetical protein
MGYAICIVDHYAIDNLKSSVLKSSIFSQPFFIYI